MHAIKNCYTCIRLLRTVPHLTARVPVPVLKTANGSPGSIANRLHSTFGMTNATFDTNQQNIT